MSEDIVILGGARTAIGTFGGALAATPPIALATQVTKAAMARAGVEPGQIGNVVFGHVINTEPRDMYLSRAAAIEAGIPETTPAMNVNRLCGSGVQAIISATQSLMLGDAALLADLATEAVALCRSQLARPLPAGFYRSSANVMRCLAFALVSDRQEKEPAQAEEIADLAQVVFSRALDLRPPPGRREKSRKVSSGIPMPDAEFMRTAALAQLLSQWARSRGAERRALSDMIGDLAVAQRTPNQRDRLRAAWQAQRQ